LRWSYQTAGPIAAQPIVAANVAIAGRFVDVLYVGDEAGTFYALDAASGTPIWTRTFGVSHSACADLPAWGITATAVLDRSQTAVYVVDGRARFTDSIWPPRNARALAERRAGPARPSANTRTAASLARRRARSTPPSQATATT